MQKAVSDVIDTSTSEDMENIRHMLFLVKHSHLYNNTIKLSVQLTFKFRKYFTFIKKGVKVSFNLHSYYLTYIIKIILF